MQQGVLSSMGNHAYLLLQPAIHVLYHIATRLSYGYLR
jgi:hypothetical protein